MKNKLIRLALLVMVSAGSLQASVAADTNDTIDVTHYHLYLDEIDLAQQSIVARTVLYLTTPHDNIDRVTLSLKQLSIDSVKVEGSASFNYTHEGDELTILLDDPISQGDTVEAEISYHGQPYHESWGGFHFSGDYAFNLGVGISEIPHNLGKSWFPCVDNFTDRAFYDLYATVPGEMTAVGGGILVAETLNGNGTKTLHWRHGHTLPTYLVSVAIGDYVAVRDTFNGVNADIPIAIYVRPQDSAKVAGTFVNLKDVLSLFEDKMGPYPWERVGYVGTALGAMEHAANIAVPHFTITGSTTYESLMVHELTHMWLGDKVTCDKAEEMWLNEGWAKFFEIYYSESFYGEDIFKETLRDLHAGVLQYCHTPGGDGSYFPLNDIPQTHTYGMSAYDKGATVTQALRCYLGDSLFFDALKAYTDTFAYDDASSYDMRDFLTAHTGIDLSDFFNNWVFHSGTPAYTVDSLTAVPAGDEYQVSIFVKQKRKGPAYTGDRNILQVTFIGSLWEIHDDTLIFDGETGVKTLMLPFAPAAVFIDKEEKMCDATTDSHVVLEGTGDHSFPKTFFKIGVEDINDSAWIQAIHFWAPPDSLKEAVPGLTLSDYRYWRIAGVLPGVFQATGSFFYTRGSYLDQNLIGSETDSIVLLYRKDATEDWQDIPFERIGLWHIGNLVVPDLLMGEYTLAVWDISVGVGTNDNETGRLEIYPNPSEGKMSVSIDVKDASFLSVYDLGGKEVMTRPVGPSREKVTLDAGFLPAGTYLVAIRDKNGRRLASEKLVLKK